MRRTCSHADFIDVELSVHEIIAELGDLPGDLRDEGNLHGSFGGVFPGKGENGLIGLDVIDGKLAVLADAHDEFSVG